MVNTLRRKLITRVWPVAVATVVIAAICAFLISFWSARTAASFNFEKFVETEGAREDKEFQALSRVQEQVAITQKRFFENLTDAQIDAHFETIFEARADGSRRTADRFFDGFYHQEIGYVHGFAAFIAANVDLTPELKRTIVSAALAVIRHSDAAASEAVPNVYYVNIDLNVLAIFAPNRADQLNWYRYEMPADFNIASTLSEKDLLRFKNAYREGLPTRCTGLGALVADPTGKTLISGCSRSTQINDPGTGWFDGIGSTLMFKPYSTAQTYTNGVLPVRAFTLEASGKLGFHSNWHKNDVIKEEEHLKLQEKYNFQKYAQRITEQDQKTGVISAGNWSIFSGLLAYHKLDGRDQIFVIEVPLLTLVFDAFTNSLLVFLASLMLGLAAVWRIFSAVSSTVEPLEGLADLLNNAITRSDYQDDVSDMLQQYSRRDDEVGLLATAVQKYRFDLLMFLETIKQQKEELENALQTEIKVNELQNQFVSTVSHEIRTPLAIIDGNAGRVERKAERMSTQDIQSRMSLIRDAVRRLTGLMERTLETSKLVSGKIEMKALSYNLAEQLRMLAHHQLELSPSHQIELQLDDIPEEFYGDQRLLELVFSNLISNAVKYSAKNPNVRIKGSVENGNLLVHIKDFGVGIPAEELPKISERFFRASTSAGIQGTGIGLNLVKTLIEQHEGYMTVDSKEGEWAEFTVHLPIFEEVDLDDFMDDAA